MRGSTRRTAAAFVLGAALAAAFFVGRTAFGAGPTGTIHACFKPSNGNVYVIGMSHRSACKPNDVAFDWNVQGPPGPAGTGVTSQTLAVGDAHCPNGGSAFTASNGTTYACNGADGRDGTFTGKFTSPNGQNSIEVSDNGVVIATPNGRVHIDSAGVKVESGTDLLLKAAGDATVQGGSTAHVKGAGTVDVQGAAVHVNGGAPVARVGDLVNVTVSGPMCGCVGTGTIVTGSPTVGAG